MDKLSEERDRGVTMTWHMPDLTLPNLNLPLWIAQVTVTLLKT